jgi:hypothetical protein
MNEPQRVRRGKTAGFVPSFRSIWILGSGGRPDHHPGKMAVGTTAATMDSLNQKGRWYDTNVREIQTVVARSPRSREKKQSGWIAFLLASRTRLAPRDDKRAGFTDCMIMTHSLA